jgi:hypothetical protein
MAAKLMDGGQISPPSTSIDTMAAKLKEAGKSARRGGKQGPLGLRG